jgi:hypothetical protein
MHAWAKIGASARLKDLSAELAAIRRAFPDLVTPRSVARASRMSAKARKAVSERMTKFWAAKRAEKKKASAGRA